MRRTIRLGPVGDVYAWFYLEDGHIIDQGWDMDLKIARQQASESAATNKTEEK